MEGRIHNNTLTTILMALVVAAIAVPGAGAGSPQQPAVPASLAQIQHPGGVSDFDTYDFVQPTGVYETWRQPTSAGATAAGFAWRDAAIGGIFMVGLGLLAAGVLLAVRRSRAVAHEASARLTTKASRGGR